MLKQLCNISVDVDEMQMCVSFGVTMLAILVLYVDLRLCLSYSMLHYVS